MLGFGDSQKQIEAKVHSLATVFERGGQEIFFFCDGASTPSGTRRFQQEKDTQLKLFTEAATKMGFTATRTATYSVVVIRHEQSGKIYCLKLRAGMRLQTSATSVGPCIIIEGGDDTVNIKPTRIPVVAGN